ncbi:MAG: STAS domain-containing protein [Pseudomonadota bacterium]
MSEPGVCYRLVGEVGFDNLMAARRDGEAAIAAAPDPAVIDLSALENANSAVVALLMAWFRAARHQGKRIVFAHAPEGVRSIVALSGMTDVLPLGDEQPAH